jgi:hypothetical protein
MEKLDGKSTSSNGSSSSARADVPTDPTSSVRTESTVSPARTAGVGASEGADDLASGLFGSFLSSSCKPVPAFGGEVGVEVVVCSDFTCFSRAFVVTLGDASLLRCDASGRTLGDADRELVFKRREVTAEEADFALRADPLRADFAPTPMHFSR